MGGGAGELWGGASRGARAGRSRRGGARPGGGGGVGGGGGGWGAGGVGAGARLGGLRRGVGSRVRGGRWVVAGGRVVRVRGGGVPWWVGACQGGAFVTYFGRGPLHAPVDRVVEPGPQCGHRRGERRVAGHLRLDGHRTAGDA